MAKIKEIQAQQILNAKGLPTVAVTVVLSDGKIGVASCPTGEIIGDYEASDLKEKAVNNIRNIISPALIGKEAERQQEIDKIMIDLDGTQNKSRLGANAMITVSMAAAKAAAESSVLPLFLYLRQFIKKDHGPIKIPVPIFNLINGEKNQRYFSDFHEFLVVPASSKPYTESIQIGEKIHSQLKKIVEAKNSQIFSDYEEGFTLSLKTNKEAFSYIKQAIEDSHVRLGFDVFFGLNPRASRFFKDGKYHVKDAPTALSSSDLVNYYDELNKEMHLLYLEDPLDQNDWDGWKLLFEKLSATTIIAGGDLIATNPYRLQMALDKKAVNGIVIKPNQVGTVIESLAIAEAAKETGLKIIVSHRSNETNDDFIADFSVAVAADYIKIGSISRGENIAKYNRLLQIDNQLKIL